MTRVTEDVVREFISETQFNGYQSIPLPFGLKTPGPNRTPSLDQIFGAGVKGKSVLDIGTNYGLFSQEAVRRGATKVVGIEMNETYFEIAKKISELYQGTYSVLHGDFEKMVLDETFDIVLVLNVIHHVHDPITFIERALTNCRELMVVEFCLPSDPEYIMYLYPWMRDNRIRRLLAGIEGGLVDFFGRHLPLMAVGNRQYHRTFYFSKKAFYNLFVLHNQFFKSVRFVDSVYEKHRVVAFCEPA